MDLRTLTCSAFWKLHGSEWPPCDAEKCEVPAVVAGEGAWNYWCWAHAALFPPKVKGAKWLEVREVKSTERKDR